MTCMCCCGRHGGAGQGPRSLRVTAGRKKVLVTIRQRGPPGGRGQGHNRGGGEAVRNAASRTRDRNADRPAVEQFGRVDSGSTSRTHRPTLVLDLRAGTGRQLDLNAASTPYRALPYDGARERLYINMSSSCRAGHGQPTTRGHGGPLGFTRTAALSRPQHHHRHAVAGLQYRT